VVKKKSSELQLEKRTEALTSSSCQEAKAENITRSGRGSRQREREKIDEEGGGAQKQDERVHWRRRCQRLVAKASPYWLGRDVQNP
jgi:hypothetical protein